MKIAGRNKIPILPTLWLLILSFGLLLQSPTDLVCQSQLRAEQFFQLKPSNSAEAPQSRYVRYPLIDKYEFRTETDEFNFGRQEYSLRIMPSNFKTKRAQTSLDQYLQNKPNYDRQEWRCNITYQMNRDWLDLWYHQQLLLILEEQKIITQDQIKLAQNSLVALRKADKEWIDWITSETDLDLDIERIKHTIQQILNQYEFPDSVQLQHHLFPIDQLAEKMQTQEPNPSERSSEDSYDLALIDKELQLERAEQKQFIDFVQFNYQGPHDDLLNERVSIGAAFNINNHGNRQLKISELETERLWVEAEIKTDHERWQAKWDEAKVRILSDLAYYQYVERKSNEENKKLKILEENLLTSDQFDPKIILDIKERKIESTKLLLKLKKELYEFYLEQLYDSELICQSQRLDWLSDN